MALSPQITQLHLDCTTKEVMSTIVTFYKTEVPEEELTCSAEETSSDTSLLATSFVDNAMAWLEDISAASSTTSSSESLCIAPKAVICESSVETFQAQAAKRVKFGKFQTIRVLHLSGQSTRFWYSTGFLSNFFYEHGFTANWFWPSTGYLKFFCDFNKDLAKWCCHFWIRKCGLQHRRFESFSLSIINQMWTPQKSIRQILVAIQGDMISSEELMTSGELGQLHDIVGTILESVETVCSKGG